jgi:hypothetical protein
MRILPVPDGSIDAADWTHLYTYRGITIGAAVTAIVAVVNAQPLRRPRRPARSFVVQPKRSLRPILKAIGLVSDTAPGSQALGTSARGRGERQSAHQGYRATTPQSFVIGGRFADRHYSSARGLYRIFNATEYRFYRSSTGPPLESDSPFATSSSLPHTPADTYGDGTWYLSLSWFNGVVDSGFLPVGPNGETYLKLVIAGGVETPLPPNPPLDMRLSLLPDGDVRVHAVYAQQGALRATRWGMYYEINPPALSEDVDMPPIPGFGLAVLQHDIAANDLDVVQVWVYTERQVSAVWYSSSELTRTITADGAAPATPPAGDRWAGLLSEDV